MQHSADKVIETPAGDIGLLFNSFAYKKYCERKGIELDALMKQISDMLNGGAGLGLSHISDLLLAAHQSYCAYNKLPFTAGELEACEWMDAVGGPVNGLQAYADIIKLFVSKLLNIDTEQLETKVEEKKSTSQPSALPGESSIS